MPAPSAPRPLADAPLGQLLARAPDIAREWLLATLADAPLDAIDSVQASEFARRAPELCGAIVRALGSDAELARLSPGGDLAELAASAGRLTGATEPLACASAVERLRTSIWAAAMDELERPGPALVASLADRLAHVSALVGGTAAAAVAKPAPLVVRPSGTSRGGHTSPRGLEERIGAGGRFALLLVELEDVRRLALADATPVERAIGALRDAVRGGDLVVQDGEGRAWVIADALERRGAEELGHRLASAVRELGAWRGAPLLVSIGVAVHPEDGVEAAALAAAAEEGVFAARAAGAPLEG